MDQKRLLELAGVTEAIDVEENKVHDIVRGAIENLLDLVDLEDGGESLTIAINKIVADAVKKIEQVK